MVEDVNEMWLLFYERPKKKGTENKKKKVNFKKKAIYNY